MSDPLRPVRPALPFSGLLGDELQRLHAEGLRRSLRAAPTGTVSFAENDYLGLRHHPDLAASATAAAREWGCGSGSSRLIAGSSALTARLESELAAFKGYESALVFSTGYQAAVGTLSALAGPGDEIYLDKLDHASLIDGARLSGARVRAYPHGSTDKLKRLLQRPARGRRLIVSDGLFSMDGDLAPLVQLGELAREYGAGLMVDEAHATACLGANGRGSAEALGAEHLVAISMGTLSKALGSLGGFICSSREVVDTLVNRARSLIYTTAPAPPQLAAALAALQLCASDPARRDRLARRSHELLDGLARAGFDTGESVSHIVPVILGDNHAVLGAAAHLRESGYHCPAVRYPTVPRGKARLRLSVCSEHRSEEIAGLIAALVAWRDGRR